jgi:hypothetical protein
VLKTPGVLSNADGFGNRKSALEIALRAASDKGQQCRAGTLFPPPEKSVPIDGKMFPSYVFLYISLGNATVLESGFLAG